MNVLAGKLVIISGPSGVGKTTITRKILELSGVVKSISVTTRIRRSDEIAGKDYFFWPKSRFKKAIENGEFLEYAEIFGNLYGTPKKFVEDTVKYGKVVVLEIDVQGTNAIKKMGIDCFAIFILPPSIDELKKRLSGRKTENPATIEYRIMNAKEEIAQKNMYDLCVVNDDVDKAVEAVKKALTPFLPKK